MIKDLLIWVHPEYSTVQDYRIKQWEQFIMTFPQEALFLRTFSGNCLDECQLMEVGRLAAIAKERYGRNYCEWTGRPYLCDPTALPRGRFIDPSGITNLKSGADPKDLSILTGQQIRERFTFPFEKTLIFGIGGCVEVQNELFVGFSLDLRHYMS